jgi:gentisate 1,2-dioxygenase
MLRPREERRLPQRSASAALHVICGAGDVEIDGTPFRFEERDVVAIPTHSRVRIGNRSADAPAFVFMVDDAPLQRKMRIYREFEENEA